MLLQRPSDSQTAVKNWEVDSCKSKIEATTAMACEEEMAPLSSNSEIVIEPLGCARMAGELEHWNPDSKMLFATSLATLHGSVYFASCQYAGVLSLD